MKAIKLVEELEIGKTYKVTLARTKLYQRSANPGDTVTITGISDEHLPWLSLRNRGKLCYKIVDGKAKLVEQKAFTCEGIVNGKGNPVYFPNLLVEFLENTEEENVKQKSNK